LQLLGHKAQGPVFASDFILPALDNLAFALAT